METTKQYETKEPSYRDTGLELYTYTRIYIYEVYICPTTPFPPVHQNQQFNDGYSYEFASSCCCDLLLYIQACGTFFKRSDVTRETSFQWGATYPKVYDKNCRGRNCFTTEASEDKYQDQLSSKDRGLCPAFGF